MALKCGKKRLLYSKNEESAVHSWPVSEWRKNKREREKEKTEGEREGEKE